MLTITADEVALFDAPIDRNLLSLDLTQLHAAAYAIMQPHLGQSRSDAVERFGPSTEGTMREQSPTWKPSPGPHRRPHRHAPPS